MISTCVVLFGFDKMSTALLRLGFSENVDSPTIPRRFVKGQLSNIGSLISDLASTSSGKTDDKPSQSQVYYCTKKVTAQNSIHHLNKMEKLFFLAILSQSFRGIAVSECELAWLISFFGFLSVSMFSYIFL